MYSANSLIEISQGQATKHFSSRHIPSALYQQKDTSALSLWKWTALAFECQGDIGRCTLYKPLALEKGVGEILANCHVMQNG